MNPYKFEPKICSEKDSGVTGHVILKPRSLPEKYRNIAKCDLKIDSKGEMQADLSAFNGIADMMEISEKYYEKVEIKVNDRLIKSYKELSYTPECESILMEVAIHCIGSTRLGESLPPT